MPEGCDECVADPHDGGYGLCECDCHDRPMATVPAVALSPEDARRLHAAASKVRSSTAERNHLIRKASADGASLREIAAAVGLNHTGVRKIILRAQQP